VILASSFDFHIFRPSSPLRLGASSALLFSRRIAQSCGESPVGSRRFPPLMSRFDDFFACLSDLPPPISGFPFPFTLARGPREFGPFPTHIERGLSQASSEPPPLPFGFCLLRISILTGAVKSPGNSVDSRKVPHFSPPFLKTLDVRSRKRLPSPAGTAFFFFF